MSEWRAHLVGKQTTGGATTLHTHQLASPIHVHKGTEEESTRGRN